MYSNMCVKIALCLALIVCIDGYVLKDHRVPLSPEGMTLELTLKNKGDNHSVSAMKIDIDEQNKKVVMSMVKFPLGMPKHHPGPLPDNVPILENRNGIRVGSCPSGTTAQGGFCFPTDDA